MFLTPAALPRVRNLHCTVLPADSRQQSPARVLTGRRGTAPTLLRIYAGTDYVCETATYDPVGSSSPAADTYTGAPHLRDLPASVYHYAVFFTIHRSYQPTWTHTPVSPILLFTAADSLAHALTYIAFRRLPSSRSTTDAPASALHVNILQLLPRTLLLGPPFRASCYAY